MLVGTLGDRPSGVILLSRSEFDFVLSRCQDNVDQLAQYAPQALHHEPTAPCAVPTLGQRVGAGSAQELHRGARKHPQAPHAISWTLPLCKLRTSGDTHAGDVVKARNRAAHTHRQLV